MHNGGQHCPVRVACTEEDFEMMQGLYDFTASLLSKAATGTLEGYQNIYTAVHPAQ